MNFFAVELNKKTKKGSYSGKNSNKLQPKIRENPEK
jgi:hypothetical protein